MALDKQINLYGVDTNAFLSERELEIKRKCKKDEVLKDQRLFEEENTKLRGKLKKFKSLLKKMVGDEYDCDTINSIIYNIEFVNSEIELNNDIMEYIKKELKWRKEIEKEGLLLEFLRAVTINKMHRENKKILRTLDKRYLKYIDKEGKEQINLKKVIGMFESSLARSFNIETNSLTEDIIIVDIFYYDLAQDLILNGFLHNGEKYIYFSSSAGQIRTKKAVFVKEKLFKENERKLTCGLTLDSINSHGGMNINKYLAYLSLCNSATDPWEVVFENPFDIDRAIVVDDFETLVDCVVDDINYETYKIQKDVEQKMPIPHTDGCGMILSSYSKKNFMVRLPWIKGLLGSFDFKKFIEINNCSPIVKDIWGKEYDIIKDDIQIIFTKSQLKMYKYYKSWQQYKNYFKKYGCEACVCNMEEDKISTARINYQMLQTLHDMTDDEVTSICRASKTKIDKLSDSLSNIIQFYKVYDLQSLEDNEEENEENYEEEEGIHKYQESYFQKALKIYPELINDPATKEDIKALKDSLVKQYKAGKLEVVGKFTFVLPDLYAFCQWLFKDKDTNLNQEIPTGLLKKEEVFCRLYKTSEELDCLRSPSLYIEHAVRKNVCNKVIKNEEDENDKGIILSDWFTTDAIYTSTYDLISRILQFDVDGDRLLVLAQKNIIDVAKKNMDGVNPLYYEMKKAKSEILNKQAMYKGLTMAFTGGNIGSISNDITKIWNSNNEIDETALKAVRWLCMETNFTIDYAKTLFKPTRPKSVDKILKEYGKQDLPFFFQYAKNKKADRCAPINNRTMNKITAEINNTKLSFKEIKNLERPKLEILLSRDASEINEDKFVVAKYYELSKTYWNKINGDKYSSNIQCILNDIKNQFRELGYSDIEVSDIICKELYEVPTTRKKNLFWRLYGDIILSNIKKHLEKGTACCKHCGKRLDKHELVGGKCKTCNNKYEKIGSKIIICKDCGKEFEIDAKDNTTCRCNDCYKKYRKEYYKIKKREQRAKKKEQNI